MKRPANAVSSPRRQLRVLGLAAAVISLIILAAALIGSSWSKTPHAPSLENTPVYQNDVFRFMVPEGWSQHARAELPPGRLDRERLLVSYLLLQSPGPPTFQVTAVDLPPDTDLGKYLSGEAFAIEDWRIKSGQAMTIGGQNATRYDLVRASGRPGTREVTAFRRNGRVYFFSAMVPEAGAKAREQIHRAIETLVWK
jgi:hypothetical protein